MIHSVGSSRRVVTLLVALIALFSSNLANAFVAPIRPHSAEINPTSFAGTIVSRQTNDPVSGTKACHRHHPHQLPRQHRQLSLGAVPPTVWWVLGHTTLPFSGVPFVINGTREGGWYRKIDLPSWTPPDALFGPVWTFLYTCMGLAVARISKLSAPKPILKNNLVLLWIAHFCLNMSWAPIFFGLQRFRLGLVISYGLVASLGVILPLFRAVDPTAAALLIPYGLWLAFATFGLNLSICKRNPTINGYNEGMFQAQLIALQERAAAIAATF